MLLGTVTSRMMEWKIRYIENESHVDTPYTMSWGLLSFVPELVKVLNLRTRVKVQVTQKKATQVEVKVLKSTANDIDQQLPKIITNNNENK